MGYRVEPRTGGTLARDGEGRAVQLVRVRRGDAAGARAVDALLAAEGPHVQRVLDLGTAVNGDLVAVLEPLPHDLADLLAVPGWPTAAEAVTVLVPLVETLARLHERGVAHGAIGPPAVGFDEAGTPVLRAFEAAVLRRVAGERAFRAAAEADDAALSLLARSVLRRAAGLLAVELVEGADQSRKI